MALILCREAHNNVLPNGIEEMEVLGERSIHVAILLSCQDMKTIALQCREIYVVGSKNKKNIRGSTQATIHPLAIIVSMSV